MISTILIIGCSQTPITNRVQIITTSKAQELKQGKNLYNKILKRVKLSQNKKAIEIINRVGQKLLKVINQEYDTSNYDWQFNIVDNKWVANAVCFPAGGVLIYSGLFPYIDNEDELAVVLGHEIAHALARHRVESKTNLSLSKVFEEITKIYLYMDKNSLAFQKEIDNKKAETLIKEWINLPHSRKQEYEADYIGLILSSKAGYNPKAYLSFWRKFAQESARKPEFASTHPTPKHRIEKMEEILRKILLDKFTNI